MQVKIFEKKDSIPHDSHNYVLNFDILCDEVFLKNITVFYLKFMQDRSKDESIMTILN
jgi:hypothetical protein